MCDCSGAILMRAGRVLLGRRSPHLATFPDCWDVLGGHLKQGESFEEALLREIEEEAGVVPTEFRELCRFPIGGELRLYLVTAWSGGEPHPRGQEHSEMRWFTVAEAARLPGVVAPELRDVFRGGLLRRSRGTRRGRYREDP